MAELMLIRQGDSLKPFSDADLEVLRKFPHGKTLRAKVTAMRNYQFHKKAFCLLSLAFQYWTPATYITRIEKNTVNELFKFLCEHNMDKETVHTLCNAFLKRLHYRRSTICGVIRSFDEFRKWATIEAGFYDTVITPSGVKKVAKSISFAEMDEETFGEFYKAVFDVCWGLCLSATFKTPAEAEAAAEQVLGFS